MHRFWMGFIVSMLLLTNGYALIDFDYKVGAGYREDHFNWAVAAPDKKPDILSELTWKDIASYHFMGTGKISILGITARFKGDYGRIFHGRNRDSDYLENGRKQEFSRAYCDSGKGEVFDLSAGLGYQTTWFCSLLKIIPLVGWSHHELHLRDYNGRQVISLFGETGEIPNLHSNYRAKWSGPWAGIDAFGYLGCLTFYGTFEYHWAHYGGKGHWNLRTDFTKDFKQCAHAIGSFYTLGAQYQFDCGLLIGVEGNYRRMNSWHGINRIYSIFGNGSTRFNGAKWRSYSVLGTLSYML